ncbi:MAG: hypothetical protein NTW66_00500 [Candidatus Magasanikbacteria bacterium]|nr:hypothetical protein [Candidatus Magasanikbacteria bacterium]
MKKLKTITKLELEEEKENKKLAEIVAREKALMTPELEASFDRTADFLVANLNKNVIAEQKIKKDKETFDTLWQYCTDDNRVCPNPSKWNDLFGMLKNTKQKSDGGWNPSLPLILAAWEETTPLEKQLRLKEHIQWAADNNQLNEVGKFIRSMPESEWTHFEEK